MNLLAVPSFFRGNTSNPTIVSPLFGENYFIGLSVCAIIIATLFIFRSSYSKLSGHKSFGYALGGFQIIMYICYYVFHELSHDLNWTDYFPFQLCSVLDITVAILLIFPCQKLFNLTFPFIAPVVLAFLLPDAQKRCFGPNNFFYYDYYLNHLIILFGYFYLYLYGHISYNRFFLKKSILALTCFGFVVFLFNVSFQQNFMFVGDHGYQFVFGAFIFDTGTMLPIFRFGFMFLIGIIFLASFHYLIIKYLKPYYFNCGTKINPHYSSKRFFIRWMRHHYQQEAPDCLIPNPLVNKTVSNEG